MFEVGQKVVFTEEAKKLFSRWGWWRWFKERHGLGPYTVTRVLKNSVILNDDALNFNVAWLRQA